MKKHKACIIDEEFLFKDICPFKFSIPVCYVLENERIAIPNFDTYKIVLLK